MRALPWVGVFAAFLGSAEIALRLADFQYLSDDLRAVVWSKERDLELRSEDGLHVFDRAQMWKPRPGARIPWTKDERVNAHGFRGPELRVAKTPGVVRIALLGPSSTFGTGVSWTETYGALLVRSLASLGVQAEVLDAGVVGSTIRQGIERYRRDVRPFAPDIVVCAYSGLHEHVQGASCTSDADRIERGIAMPDWTANSSARDQVRVAQAVVWLTDVYLGGWWKERENAMQEARLARTVGTFDSAGVRRVSPAEMRDGWIELANLVREDGGELVALLVPYKPGGSLDSPVMHYYQKATEIGCELEQIPVVQARLTYFRGVTSGIKPEELFLADGDASDCGHELIAQSLIDALLPRLTGR